jgi:hypothetical protein
MGQESAARRSSSSDRAAKVHQRLDELRRRAAELAAGERPSPESVNFARQRAEERCSAPQTLTTLRLNDTRSRPGSTSERRTAINVPQCVEMAGRHISCRKRPTATGGPRTIVIYGS